MTRQTTWIASLALLALAWLGLGAPAQAQTLSPNVANDLLRAYELLENDETREALTALNRLMERRGDAMTPFDRASVLQIRGSAYVQLDDFERALTDFERAIAQDALPSEQVNRLRFNMAQLYFVTEQFEKSIEFFERWLADDPEVSANTYFMLSGAYYQVGNLERSLESVTKAIELSSAPERRQYELKNVLLNELNRVRQRTELLARMVVLWPDELSFWRQLSALYLDQDDQLRAFGALESAYLAGLVKDERDILLLGQFYSSFNNPYRGGRLIEREMDAGRVERSVANLELLSQLWSQAREHRLAIPILREAARLSDTGQLSFRLGQALLADENHSAAETAFQAAIDKGELDDNILAEAWMLLGNARFNQAGPGDRQQRRSADQAFAQAERFAATRSQARGWRDFIRAIDDTETRQAQLEQEQAERLEEAAQERALMACRAQQLAGTTLSAECRRLLAAEEERLDRELEQQP